MFGVPPNRYRSLHADGRAIPDRRLWMPQLTTEYLQHIISGDCLKPVLTKKGALQLTGLMSLIKDRATITHLWHILTRELAQLENADQPPEHYGIAWYPAGWQRDGYLYLAAIDVPSLRTSQPLADEAQRLHPALLTKTLPPLTCARFVH
jgi:hypothetical protein